jgi:hypothetical protein
MFIGLKYPKLFFKMEIIVLFFCDSLHCGKFFFENNWKNMQGNFFKNWWIFSINPKTFEMTKKLKNWNTNNKQTTFYSCHFLGTRKIKALWANELNSCVLNINPLWNSHISSPNQGSQRTTLLILTQIRSCSFKGGFGLDGNSSITQY